MRPQVDDQTAAVVEELADELTEIDVDMLTFDQQLRVVLKKMDGVEFSAGRSANRRLTREGEIVGKL